MESPFRSFACIVTMNLEEVRRHRQGAGSTPRFMESRYDFADVLCEHEPDLYKSLNDE